MNSSKLKAIIKDIFIKYKLSKDHASICAEALINAELVGAPSHGLSRLKMYCDRISKKVINPRAKIKIKKIINIKIQYFNIQHFIQYSEFFIN